VTSPPPLDDPFRCYIENTRLLHTLPFPGSSVGTKADRNPSTTPPISDTLNKVLTNGIVSDPVRILFASSPMLVCSVLPSSDCLHTRDYALFPVTDLPSGSFFGTGVGHVGNDVD
jgi:hypothetical protein